MKSQAKLPEKSKDLITTNSIAKVEIPVAMIFLKSFRAHNTMFVGLQ
jgi:hypothetical protein